MLKVLFNIIPVPTLLGFVMSLMATAIGFTFSISIDGVFLTMVTLSWLLLFMSEYRLSFMNHLLIIIYTLLGHLPVFIFMLFF